MKNDLYDNADEFKSLIASLKELPKIETPKNFETNLQRRINHLQYEEPIGFWAKLINEFKTSPAVPATTLASLGVAVVLFFLLPFRADRSPIMQTNELTSIYYKDSIKLSEKPLIKPENISSNDVIMPAKTEVAAVSAKSGSEAPSSQPATEGSKEGSNSANYNYYLAEEDSYGGNSVDQTLRARPNRNSSGGGIGANVSFNGFNLAPQVDQEALRAMKRKIDSLNMLRKQTETNP